MLGTRLKGSLAFVSTAWTLDNVSIPAYGKFRVFAQETSPEGLFFKSDGTKMYVIGDSGNDVNEYTLSSAWAISTASYVQNFSVAAQETNPTDLFFKSDGTKMYVIGTSGQDVNEYTLSSAWDISTASYSQNFSVATEDGAPEGLFFKDDGTKMYITGSESDTVWSYTLSSAWDISTASIPAYGKFSVATQETNPQDIFFKDDGTKMYVIGSSGDDVNEYTLSSAWNISTASYVQNFSVASEEIAPTGLFFKDDGTKMYVLGTTGDDVNEYTLSSAWDISTASYVQNFSVATEDTVPEGLFFKSDGTKMYVIGRAGDNVYEYTLSSAWDISTASYAQNFSVATEDTNPHGVFFKPDGTKMYVIGDTGDDVNEYTLSSAWDISTASYAQNFSVSAQETTPEGVFFKSDGTKMYVIGSSVDAVFSYTLSSAWDISTASWDAPPANSYFSVAAQESIPTGLSFKDDGTKMYITGDTGDDVNEYTLSSAWDISTASYVQNFSVAAQDASPTGLFFKSDGTRMYITGSSNDAVFSYTLSSAWDISTASWDAPANSYFSVVAEETASTSLSFKDDGTKMYVLGNSGDDVNEYTLSSAWDISTASYVQSFSVTAQEGSPQGLFFKDDGTKMYVIGAEGDDVNEYSLSSAWDISTASYVQNFSVATEETVPLDLFFKSDGTKMYVIGSTGDDVNEYSLSSAWDISTASYVQNFSVATEETGPSGLFFKPDGTKMYVIGSAGDAVNEYTLSSAWDISTASYVQNFSVATEETGPSGLFFKPDGTKMYVIGFTADAVWAYSLV